MIQTILITALSAQLTYLKPAPSAQPPTPQYTFTRVLPRENDVKPVVKKTTELNTITLPELSTNSVFVNQLQEPMAGASASPTIVTTTIDNFNTSLPTATPTPQPTAAPTVITPSDTEALVSLAPANTVSSISDTAITYLGSCEAGMNPARNSGNGYYGAFQFSYGTWKNLNTGYERADLAPIEVQEAAVRQLLSHASIYNQFPACAQKMHAAGLI